MDFFNRNTPNKVWRDQDFIVKGGIISDMVAVFERNYADQKLIKKKHVVNTDETWSLWRKNLGSHFKPVLLSLRGDQNILKKISNIENESSKYSPSLMPAKARFFQNRPRYHETSSNKSIREAFLLPKIKFSWSTPTLFPIKN